MPGGKCNIKIDSEKLKNAIVKKDMKVSDAGVRCGYSTSGIQNAVDRGSITLSMAVLIDKVLGIPLEDYKFVEPADEPLPEEKPQEVDQDQILYKTVYAAAYAAIKAFMSELEKKEG